MSSNDRQLQNDCIALIKIIFDNKLEDYGNYSCTFTADKFYQKILPGVFFRIMEKIF